MCTDERITGYNSTYKKLAVQWLNEALFFVSSFVVADSFRLRNRQLLVAANRCRRFQTSNITCFGIKTKTSANQKPSKQSREAIKATEAKEYERNEKSKNSYTVAIIIASTPKKKQSKIAFKKSLILKVKLIGIKQKSI